MSDVAVMTRSTEIHSDLGVAPTGRRVYRHDPTIASDRDTGREVLYVTMLLNAKIIYRRW
jgi:hypothetical protein